MMLNESEGELLRFDDTSCIVSKAAGETHLVFGPYETLDAGQYVARFRLARLPGSSVEGDRLCAILDVAAEHGGRIIAHDFVVAGQLSEEFTLFELPFDLEAPASGVEYRVRASGGVAVVAADDASATPRGPAASTASLAPQCPLVLENPLEVVDLFRRGYVCRFGEGGIVFETSGLRFFARERDDINFVGEVLEQKAYNLLSARDQCVIDIGMNVGLTTLSFAARPAVAEVHSFEPFEETYRKARINIALNGRLAAKISTYNFGLSNRAAEETILVPSTNDSGSRDAFGADHGEPVRLVLRDAATQLRPVINAALARGRQIVMKVDCEGSEYAIFDSLAKAGLLTRVDAFLVEWHAMFADKSVADLTGPLLAAGYLVVDLSPPRGNGFFYAFRGAGAQARGWRAALRQLTA